MRRPKLRLLTKPKVRNEGQASLVASDDVVEVKEPAL